MVRFSVICVYNDADTLAEWLRRSLNEQPEEYYELILLDNRKSQFSSAAAALNRAAEQATGEYYIFVHQDVRLLSEMWLEDAYEQLESIGDLGIAGVAGMSAVGSRREDRGRNTIYYQVGEQPWPLGNEIQRPEPVRTVDELLLIVPSEVFADHQFDEQLCDGWHLYGVEYSIRMRERASKGVYVLPLPVHHGSTSASTQWGRVEYLRTLIGIAEEYDTLDRIYTTVGNWPADPDQLRTKLRTEIIRRRLPSVPKPVRRTGKALLNRTPWLDFS